ncbi:hypothetical protein GDO81_012768 [Engystomops pustulosus]|uniref:Uncharacterized protein n=1 Tax=Engystomops pustulosus TaxID=76066 RepID=A0AAV7B158_ENGPU|nr:hypothetical protein GDO81_012768 [Engystomops pustulosus]
MADPDSEIASGSLEEVCQYIGKCPWALVGQPVGCHQDGVLLPTVKKMAFSFLLYSIASSLTPQQKNWRNL